MVSIRFDVVSLTSLVVWDSVVCACEFVVISVARVVICGVSVEEDSKEVVGVWVVDSEVCCWVLSVWREVDCIVVWMIDVCVVSTGLVEVTVVVIWDDVVLT